MAVFKVWNLSKATKNGSLACLQTCNMEIFKPTAKPTCLAVAENCQFMAIGFDRGSISLYRTDIRNVRAKNNQTLLCGIAPITGIAYKQSNKYTQMFVCSDSGVLVYNLQSKDKLIKIVLDKEPGIRRCCAMRTTQYSNDAYFTVAQDDVS